MCRRLGDFNTLPRALTPYTDMAFATTTS